LYNIPSALNIIERDCLFMLVLFRIYNYALNKALLINKNMI
jgi:hypothetical protein